ncbi:MAG: ASKHA domain-containing protein [Pseudomonadota bacterium]
MDREIVRVRPGIAGPGLGLAVDLGSTTIAAFLSRLDDGEIVGTAAMMNPQVAFGEDVMSRISYCLDQADGLDRLRRVVIDGLNGLIGEALAEAAAAAGLGPGFNRADIEDLALCGNTTMQHLLLGLDPSGLGTLPFTPAARRGLTFKARDLGLEVNPSANIFIAPAVSGFVGGDAVCATLAEAPHLDEKITLIIDIGTNGEIILGNKDRLLSASCATGPALEGARIEFGMRAAPGAIERVRIDPATLEVDYKVVGREPWRSFSAPGDMKVHGICGSGILDALAEFRLAGIINPSGAFNHDCPSSRLRKNPETGIWEFVLAPAPETALGRDVVVTLKDIRQVQLAKAALYAGCRLLLRKMGVERPDRIKIAGAFGFHIDRRLALVLGLFPRVPLEAVLSVGNAAGDGCRLALLDRAKRREADELAQRIEHVELNLEKDFQQELIAAIHIPPLTD